VSKVYGVRLPEPVATPYVELAELTGVSVASVLKETLAEAAPHVAELVVMVRKAQGGDAMGLLNSLRSLAEQQQELASQVAGELTEIENEQKVKTARKGVKAG
jgi:predicted deacylase